MTVFNWPPKGSSAFQAGSSRFVDPSGSDSSGTGAASNPWKTISHALASITDNSSNKQYSLNIGPGVYTENVTLKPYIFMVGQPFVQNDIDLGNVSCNVSINGDVKCLDSAVGIFQIVGIQIDGDFHSYTTSKTASGPFFFQGCSFGGNNFIIGDPTTAINFDVTLDNCFLSNSNQISFYSIDYDIRGTSIANPVSVFGGVGNISNSNFDSQLWSFSDDSIGNGVSIGLFGGLIGGPTFDYLGSSGAVVQTDTSFLDGALTATGGGVWTVTYSDIVSAILNQSNITALGDVTQYLVITGASNRTVTLPNAIVFSGKDITLIKADSGAGHIVISPNVNGSPQQVVTQFGVITLTSAGGSWFVKSRFLT